jgi:hypothetical protein
MEQYIKNIIPNIKQYGKLLSHKEYFLNKSWLLVNADGNIIQFTFKKNGELIVSTNGDAIKGKWELLSSDKILLENEKSTLQLENLFFNKDIIILLKPSKSEELFILINEEVLKNKDIYEYLKSVEKKGPENEEDDWDEGIVAISVVLILILFGYIIFNLNK